MSRDSTNDDNFGYVYVMENKAFPGILKIGKTSKTPAERAKNFDTPLPEPWNVICAVGLQDYSLLETTLHNLFAFRRLKKNREFFYFSYEDDAEKRDIEQLFNFFTSGATSYEAVDAKEDIATEIRLYENPPPNGVVFVLKKKDEIIMRATFDSENKEFIFDRDISGIKEPDFADNNGSALKSAKSLYNAFLADGEIDENGLFKLKGKRVPYASMSRYTIMLYKGSTSWLNAWKKEGEKTTIKDFLNGKADNQ